MIMRLPEQVINDIEEINTKRAAFDAKERALLAELEEIRAMAAKYLDAYAVVGATPVADGRMADHTGG